MVRDVCRNTEDPSLITGNPAALLAPPAITANQIKFNPAHPRLSLGKQGSDNGRGLGRRPQPPTVRNLLSAYHLLSSAAEAPTFGAWAKGGIFQDCFFSPSKCESG